MFSFLRNLTGFNDTKKRNEDDNDNPSHSNNDSQIAHVTPNLNVSGMSNASINQNDSRVIKRYYQDAKAMNDYLDLEFPFLSEKRRVLENQDPIPDHKILQRVDFFLKDDEYYTEEMTEEKLFRLEFKKLQKNNIKTEDIMVRVEKLQEYNKKVDVILMNSATKNYDKFEKGIQNMEHFSKNVNSCLINIKMSRESLKTLQEDLADKSKKIITEFKIKNSKQKELEFLMNFKEQFGGIYKVINDINENNFAYSYDIIPILKTAKIEFSKNNPIISRFNCLKNAAKYLDLKLDQMIKLAKQGLGSILHNFDENKYEGLLKCYYLLETNYTQVIPLTKEFQNIIRQGIKDMKRKSMETFVMQNGLQNLKAYLNAKTSFFISQLSKDQYMKFMNRIFHDMSTLMYNNHLCARYHEEKKEIKLYRHMHYAPKAAEYSGTETINILTYYSNLTCEYLKNRKLIWDIIQKKISKMFTNLHFYQMNYYELLEHLEYCNKFILIGEDYSNTIPKEIKEVLTERLREYYLNFKQIHFEKLANMLHNEEWRRIFNSGNYKQQKLIALLKNFPTVKNRIDECLIGIKNPKMKHSNTTSQLDLNNNNNTKTLGSALSSIVIGNPFKISNAQNMFIRQQTFEQISQKIPDKTVDEMTELDVSYVEKAVESEKKPEVVVCSSANYLVNAFETFLLLMDMIKPYTIDIFTELIRTIDLYIYMILITFTSESYRKLLYNDINLGSLITAKDEDSRIQALESLHEIFLFQYQYKNIRVFITKLIEYFESFNKTEMKLQKKITGAPSNSNNLYDLSERVIAVESMFYIYDHLKFIQYRVTKIISNNDEQYLNTVKTIYDTYAKVLPELKNYIYNFIMPNMIKNDNFFLNIPNVKWEILQLSKELSNIYIERVVYLIKDFKEKVKSLSGGIIPEPIQTYLVREVIIFTFKQLVDSYSKIKKINVCGRQMMINDFYQILEGLTKFIDMRPIPYHDYVEAYVMIWSKSAQELTDFIIQNKTIYSLRHSLTNFNTNVFICMMRKNQKKEYMNQIEAEYIELIKKGV